MEGKVVHGDHRGTLLGYPTANIQTHIPVDVTDGIYAGVITVDGDSYVSAISIGTNPTFGGIERRVEAFLITRDELNLYDRVVRVDLKQKLRDQIKFNSVDDLIQQMDEDVANVLKLF